MSAENIGVTLEKIFEYNTNIERGEAEVAALGSDIARAQAGFTVKQGEVRTLKEKHHLLLTGFQDSLFQGMAHPANRLEGEQAIEYVDYILRSTGKNPGPAPATTLSKITVPTQEVQPAYFGGMLGGRREDTIALFQGGELDTPSLAVENHSTGILTFVAEVFDAATFFARDRGSHSDWRAGYGYTPVQNRQVRIDMQAENLTITDDPEQTIQVLRKEDPAIGESIIAIGVEAVSAAIDYASSKGSRTGSSVNASNNLMKHVLATILERPIPGRSLDIDALQNGYYTQVLNSFGGTYDFRNATDLPLVLHGDIFDVLFDDGSFDQERFEQAVASGMGNSDHLTPGGHAAIKKAVKDHFWDFYRTNGGMEDACRDIGDVILQSIALNDIVRGAREDSLRLKDVLNVGSLGFPIKLAVVKEAQRQQGATYDWRDALRSKTRKLKHYKSTLSE